MNDHVACTIKHGVNEYLHGGVIAENVYFSIRLSWLHDWSVDQQRYQ
jgi:hypothetical protein